MKKIYMTLLLAVLAFNIRAQQTDELLKLIEENNVQLQALRKENEATLLEAESENSLESTSIEYSPFFRRGADGVASSELIVKQGFDFPTLYASRNKSNRLRREVLDLQYRTARREILLQAKVACQNLVYFNKVEELLQRRTANAQSLLALYNRRVEKGDATLIELNRIKMDCMNIEKEKAEVEAERNATLQTIASLNGNIPVTVDSKEYGITEVAENEQELVKRIMESDWLLQQNEAATMAGEQQVRVTRQNWIPKLEVGYRRNTDMERGSNGFLVGASFPLFSNSKKVKIARAREAAARLELENSRVKTEKRIHTLLYNARKMRSVMNTYDIGLMYNTLAMLQKAVEAGEISIIDYYREADSIYANLHSFLDVEKEYHNAMAELYKNRL